MRKTKPVYASFIPEVEPDFTHSRAGLSTHKKNSAEQQRLEDKLRCLDSLQRRTVQQYTHQQRGVLQCLAASHAARPPASPSRVGDGETCSKDNSGKVRVSRRASLQPDALSPVTAKDHRTECGTLGPPRRSRRPSVILQDLLDQPVIDVSDSSTPPTEADSDTIIDIIAARNRPRKARRASVGGASGVRNLGELSDSRQGPQAVDKMLKRTRRENIVGITMATLESFSDSPKHDCIKGSHTDTRPRRLRLGNVSETSAIESGQVSSHPKEDQCEDGGTDRALVLPVRGRRASLDVGISNLSLLSPTSQGSHGRRSSLASSQGTPSTPSTPDSRHRDVTSFAFPPVTSLNPSLSRRHSVGAKPQLQRSRSIDNIILSPATSHPVHMTSPVTSHGRQRRNSSFKLPRMQGGGRKSVMPSVNKMVLLHNVLQSSSSFKAHDFEEG